MPKKYKLWVRHGVQEGWLKLDENGIHFYVKYNDADMFKQNKLRVILKEIKSRGIKSIDARPYRYRETRK